MPDIVYSARPVLLSPRRFLADAGADLRRAPALAWRVFDGNLRARHRRSWLGYLWLLLPPLAGVAVCVLIQSRRIVTVAPTALPYALFVLSGIVLWQVFADALLAPLQQLTAARRVLRGQRVPHEAYVIAGALDVALNALVRLVLLFVALFAFAPAPVWSWALVPAAAAVMALIGLALGLFAAPLGLLYDDVGRGLQLATGFGVFLAPVLYPLPGGGWPVLVPMRPPLDAARVWLVGPGVPAAGFFIVAALAAAGLVAAWLFHRVALPHVLARQG